MTRAIVAALFFVPLAAQDWLRMHHDDASTGFQPLTGLVDGPAVKWTRGLSSTMWNGYSVADVDNDGQAEVIAAYSSTVLCLDGATGALEWSASVGNLWTTPALADVDGDANLELFFGSWNTDFYCLDGATGAVQWSYNTEGQITSSAVVADVDMDGSLEAVFGGVDSVYCFDAATGALEWGYSTGAVIQGSPSVGDVDLDGAPEIVVGSANFNVYCLSGTGTVEWTASRPNNEFRFAPALGDFDGDGLPEAAITPPDPTMYALNGEDGTSSWSQSAVVIFYYALAAADVDMDGFPEIFDCNCFRFFESRAGATGAVLWQWPLYETTNYTPEGTIALADIDGDGVIEALTTCGTDTMMVFDGATGAREWFYPVSANPQVTIADVDGDSCSEVLVGGASGNGYTLTVFDDTLNGTGCGPVGVGVGEETGQGGGWFNVYAVMGAVVVQVDGEREVKLYDVAGRMVRALTVTGEAKVALKPGVYFVKPEGGKATKAAVR